MCSFDDSLLASGSFYTFAMHIVSVLGMPIHLFGAYIIIFKTPNKMASVKFSMLVLHVSSAFSDIYLSLLATPVFLIPTAALYPTGLLTKLGTPSVLQLYLGMSSVAVTSASIIGFFENRFNRLAMGDRKSLPRSILRFLYILFHYFQAFTYPLPAFLSIPDPSVGAQMVLEKLPCIPMEVVRKSELFVLSLDNSVFCRCLVYILVFPASEIIFFCVGIIYKLYNSASTSENTNKMQKHFFIALCMQVSVPLLVLLFPAVYLIFALWMNYFNQALNNIAFIFLAVHGLFSTVVMLFVHRPYREEVIHVFRCCRCKPTVDSRKITRESRVKQFVL